VRSAIQSAAIGIATSITEPIPKSVALLGVLALASAALDRVGEAAYVRGATRAATESATIDALRPGRAAFGDFWLLSPFDYAGHDKNDLATFRGPQEELSRYSANGPGPELSRAWPGKLGVEARWTNLGPQADKKVDLTVHERDELNNLATCFVWTTIASPSAQRITLDMGSDDGLRLWCNGKLLVDHDVPRGLDPHAEHVPLDLAEGVNHLLLEVAQGFGGWDLQILTAQSLSPQEDCALQALLDRDFPSTPEHRHWRAYTLPVPDDVVLEVGGIAFFSDGTPLVCTRRGELWRVEGAYEQPPVAARFVLWASGLHEPLGLAVRAEKVRDDGDEFRDVVYCVQRGELTRLRDDDRDGQAERYECVSSGWGVSGNYHEFAFGPRFDAAGDAWVTLNVGFCGGLGKALVPWRGWAIKIKPDGSIEPWCDGLRSPNGFAEWNDGEMFYVDNQGDWMATNRVGHLRKGSWHGHPASLRWRDDLVDGKRPPLEPASVWLPYKKLGQSVADLALDTSGGRFGPFAGQFLTGDQTDAQLERVDLELVDGQYQGACWRVLGGLDSGVNRVAFAPDGSLFVGQTDRGWGSIGRKRYGLQRVVYGGVEPFELLHVRARPNGFALETTQDIDRASAEALATWRVSSFTYEHHADYGCAEMDTQTLNVKAVRVVSPRRVELDLEPLRTGYVHEIEAAGLRSASGAPLLHPMCWYTLQRLPRAP
jgi:hypothetical protein